MKATTTLNNVEALCSAVQLSAVLGVSVRQIHHCEREGVLKPAVLRPLKRYKLAESVQAYLRYSRELTKRQSSNGSSSAYDVARAKRMASLAEIERLRLQELKGKLLSREKATQTTCALLSVTKNHVLSIPNRCSRQLIGETDHGRIYAVLDDACRGALFELSRFSVEDYVRLCRTAAPEPQQQSNGESESTETL